LAEILLKGKENGRCTANQLYKADLEHWTPLVPPPPAHTVAAAPSCQTHLWWTRRGYDDEARLLEMAFCTFCTFCNVEGGGDLCFELRRAVIGRDGQQPGEWGAGAGAGILGSGNFGKGGDAAMGISATGPHWHAQGVSHRRFPPARTDVNSYKYCRPRLMMAKHREGDSAGGGVGTENTLRFCESGVFPRTKYWHQHQNQHQNRHQHQHQLLQESISASAPSPPPPLVASQRQLQASLKHKCGLPGCLLLPACCSLHSY
jgi:hypothetical protein